MGNTDDSYVTVVGLLLVFRFTRSVLIPRWSVASQKKGTWMKLSEADRKSLFDRAIRLAYRACIVGLAVHAIWMQDDGMNDWWKDTKSFWIGYPNHTLPTSLAWHFRMQIAYHMDDLLEMASAVLSRKSLRPDALETTIHHTVTVLLLILSFDLSFHRVGCIISLLHAISDVPKDLAKLFKGLGLHRAANQAFFSLIISWIVTRIVLFIGYVYPSCLFESKFAVTHGNMPSDSFSIVWFLCFCLGIIALLDIMWLILILRIGFSVQRKGIRNVQDPTEKTRPSKNASLPQEQNAKATQLSYG